ncbi:MAG: thioredoxin family protein [Phycisphaeraceae bacterium]
MTDKPKYYDVRGEFWRAIWDRSDDYTTYLQNSPPDKAARWHEMAPKIPPLGDEQRKRLHGYNRALNVLLYTGVWCGDCVRQGPMIRQITEAADDKVTLRCIDRDADPKLTDELRILGATRVPVVVFLSEDFFEVGRFGDRLLTVYRRKAATEIGAACPVPYAIPPHGELTAERDEWVDLFERMLLMTRLSPPLRQRHGD